MKTTNEIINPQNHKTNTPSVRIKVITSNTILIRPVSLKLGLYDFLDLCASDIHLSYNPFSTVLIILEFKIKIFN